MALTFKTNICLPACLFAVGDGIQRLGSYNKNIRAQVTASVAVGVPPRLRPGTGVSPFYWWGAAPAGNPLQHPFDTVLLMTEKHSPPKTKQFAHPPAVPNWALSLGGHGALVCSLPASYLSPSPVSGYILLWAGHLLFPL
ncbi:hypothetical protein CBR_g38400 [Chara braunii]|uniref:Uncharacterized protein n=1 Tax=Chara braunii TaxID=69332 RepID=A0A388JNU0_CHABU|nr:hypothetical protein CBR_g38400 [Chara braunii]|eukprot:GBG59372.1 hypothetical protein CBR_g38400 [Chara braunii]